MNNPLGVSPSKGNQGTTRGKEKIFLTSVGIEPTTSGLDLPLLCRLSYKVKLHLFLVFLLITILDNVVSVFLNLINFNCNLIIVPEKPHWGGNNKYVMSHRESRTRF